MPGSSRSRPKIRAFVAIAAVVGAVFFSAAVLLLVANGGDLSVPVGGIKYARDPAANQPPVSVPFAFALVFAAGAWLFAVLDLRASRRRPDDDRASVPGRSADR